jgi:hypothetical protein
MKKLTFTVAVSSAFAAAAIALAGPARATINPLVPIGPNPDVPAHLGFYNPNVPDDSGTINPAGGIDLAS